MTYDPNLPDPLSEDSSFLNEEVRMKECEYCNQGVFEIFGADMKCSNCEGTGEIPMTPEEIREEIENKKEKESGLYNQ